MSDEIEHLRSSLAKAEAERDEARAETAALKAAWLERRRPLDIREAFREDAPAAIRLWEKRTDDYCASLRRNETEARKAQIAAETELECIDDVCSGARPVEDFQPARGVLAKVIAALAERDRLREALGWLVELHDGPRDAAYVAEKEHAWANARVALKYTKALTAPVVAQSVSAPSAHGAGPEKEPDHG